MTARRESVDTRMAQSPENAFRSTNAPPDSEESILLNTFPSPQLPASSSSESRVEFTIARLFAEALSNASPFSSQNRNTAIDDSYIQYFAQGASAAFQTIAKFPQLVTGLNNVPRRRNSDTDTQREIDGNSGTDEGQWLNKEGMCSKFS
jgi:hypothetical protein